MAERKPPNGRSTALPEPTGPALTFRGEKPTPGMILRLWKSGMASKPKSRERILKARAFRRMEESSLMQLNPTWVRQNPEAARWVRDIRHERVTLEREQTARVGAVEPFYVCEALGEKATDATYAEEKEAYLNEWRQSAYGPPVQAFFGKSVEDGEYARVRLPAHLDMDGAPDFFDMLDEAAYDALPKADQKGYQRDEKDRRRRYVKVDSAGKKQKNPKYDKGSDDKSKEAHDAAVQRYLLSRPASNGRLIPALDCAPIFDRGKGRARWDLAALVERTLYFPEELIDAEYGWRGLGDRKLVPQAYNADGSRMRIAAADVGSQGQVYLYTAYLMCRDEKGCRHPCVYYTVGGASTWDQVSGSPDDPESVGYIDFYEELKRTDGTCPALEGAPLWSYHWGLHTEDDDPDYYAMPFIMPEIGRIQGIEGVSTSIRATVEKVAFTGHFHIPDARLADAAPDAVVDDAGDLIAPQMPGPGQILTSTGQVVPAQQAQIGSDAWRLVEMDQQALAEATMTDNGGSNASGHAMVVGETLAKVGQRHQREGVMEAVVRDAQDHLRILHAIFDKHGVRWPIQTVDELPVGDLGESRAGRKVVEYDPEWVGEQNFSLKGEYPAESNLAEQDMEMAAAERGFGSFKRVAKAMGEEDSQRAWLETLKDKMRQHPAYLEKVMMGVANQTGDKAMIQVLKALQQQKQMTQPMPGVPGGANGLPVAALGRQGEQSANGSGRPTMASRIRGGVVAGQMGTASRQADANAQLQVQPGAA